MVAFKTPGDQTLYMLLKKTTLTWSDNLGVCLVDCLFNVAFACVHMCQYTTLEIELMSPSACVDLAETQTIQIWQNGKCSPKLLMYGYQFVKF